MKAEGRIALDAFPEDWQYYTLTFPVARYKHLSLDGIIDEMISCDRDLLFHAAHPGQGMGQPVATPQAVAQPGRQSLLPEQPPAEPQGLRRLQASTRRWARYSRISGFPIIWDDQGRPPVPCMMGERT